MKAYLIDPEAKTVTGVDYDGDYKSIDRLIGADLFTTVELNDRRDVVYVDDEGLLHDPEWFFTVDGYPQPLAGKGLVLGTDAEGGTVEPKMSLGELASMVGWRRMRVDGFDVTEGEVDHPVFGKTWTISNTARLSDREGGE